MRFEITYVAEYRGRKGAVVAEYNSDNATIKVYGFGVAYSRPKILVDGEVREWLEKEAADFKKAVGIDKLEIVNIMRQTPRAEYIIKDKCQCKECDCFRAAKWNPPICTHCRNEEHWV